MSTSDELRAALNRRLKRIDVSPPPISENSPLSTASPVVFDTRSQEADTEALSQQAYRSGWSMTPPIPRSVVLPPPLLNRSSPTKSDLGTGRRASDEIAGGLVDQRLREYTPSDKRSSVGAPSAPVPLLSGHLLKYSSGALTSRWQKRFFTLHETHLEYFASSDKQGVRFPVKRMRAVQIVQSAPREFELHIGCRSVRKYQVRAESAQECRSWVNAIEMVIAKYLSSIDGEEDILTLTNDFESSHRTNDDSSEKDYDEEQVPISVPPLLSDDTLDALFSVWFDASSSLKAGPLIDAATRAISDLWAVLGGFPRGEYLELSGATRVQVGQNFSLHPASSLAIVESYLLRLCGKFDLWLSWPSNMHGEEIPVLIEWVSRLKVEVDSFDQSDSSSCLTSLISRLGSEWEVALIEKIHEKISDNFWDFPPGELGPSRVNFKFANLVKQQPILMTRWVDGFLSAINDHCLSRSTKGTSWALAYPTCITTLTSHCANALIASMNSAWREFKTRANGYANFERTGGMKKVLNRISPKKKLPFSMAFENILAFGNESTLVSVFCQHVSAVPDLKNSLPLFAVCMEGLSLAFANTAKDVAKSLVKVHFSRKNSKILAASFDPKCLSVRIKVPISDSLETASEFILSLQRNAAHELFRYLLVGHVMTAVARGYIDSLIFHQPKISKFTRLAAVVAEDEGLFFSVFRELGRPPAEISAAIDQISHVRAILGELDDTPPARGGIAVVKVCTELAKVVVPFERAEEIIKALLHIKGIGKVDRRDILAAVHAGIHRNTESPAG